MLHGHQQLLESAADGVGSPQLEHVFLSCLLLLFSSCSVCTVVLPAQPAGLSAIAGAASFVIDLLPPARLLSPVA